MNYFTHKCTIAKIQNDDNVIISLCLGSSAG
jgi:hypothetical protein